MSGHEIQSNSTAVTVPNAGRASGQSTLEKLSQLEQRVVSLERDRNSQLYNRRHEFRKVFCSLEETEIKLNQERKTEKKELSQQISRIRANVQRFQKMLEDMRPGPTFMERLKEVLEETETSILAFKDRQREVYEKLLVEERQVSQEVIAFQRRMEAWTTSTTTAAGSRGAQVTASGTAAVAGERGREREGEAALPPAMLELERFLRQTGGVRGGWDDYDHNTFLHLRTKHSILVFRSQLAATTFLDLLRNCNSMQQEIETNESALVEAALRELPTRTESEVRAHCAWFTEYSSLLEAKRLAIQQWKKNKQLARSQQLKTGAVREGDSESRRKEATAEREKREQERQINKEKLQAWKVQQEQKRQEAENARLKEEEMKAKKHEKETIRQVEVREGVRGYQERRERERQAVAEQERLRRLARERELQLQAKREIEQFRERDMRAVAERRERDRQKEAAKMEQKMRLDKLKEQVVVRVARDPERVLRPTSGWQERRKAMEREREEGGGGLAVGVGARTLPRRAVPAWRQGL